MDVFREEPVPKDSPLLKLGNVILTPHVGGGREFDAALSKVCQNVARIAQGEKPINVVN